MRSGARPPRNGAHRGHTRGWSLGQILYAQGFGRSSCLFFGSVSLFNEKFEVLSDPDEVIIDFSESRVTDMSGIEALNKITERYFKVGKKIHLKHLSTDCRKLLKNANEIIDVNVMEDPSYKVVS